MRIFSGAAGSPRQVQPARAAAPAYEASKPIASPSDERPWRDTAFLPLPRAAHVLGVSVASLYRLQQEGTLKFQKRCGRTLVRTEGVIALADADEPWTASTAGAAARAKRSELAQRAAS